MMLPMGSQEHFPVPKEKAEKQGISAEAAPSRDEEVFQDILKIEQAVSADEALEETDLRSAYENPAAITVILLNPDKKIVGFVNALPNTEVYAELSPDDPDFESNPRYLYIYDIAVEKEARSLPNFLAMMRQLVEEARQKGFTAITMHTRTAEGLSSILQKRYNAKLLRTFENWQGWGKYEYLELNLGSLKT